MRFFPAAVPVQRALGAPAEAMYKVAVLATVGLLVLSLGL
jgi:hypothetical protein